ncbi:molybdate ABC transporter permease subunit [uncultured Pseudoteredinibacter sp.]|uniref:molybdate ABC transporter permease subunit n=1 Tax=uncultured Pseudoteredinibacter sp. TaxID=1641701 RepID=UPI002617853E|nr:molybdate ABC transporter permease subunit [uncultured Pseudoteredinibacter sp.]
MMLEAILLSVKLALLSTVLLLFIATFIYLVLPKQGILQNLVNTVMMLPLVLPPTVIGFYLLLFLSPQGPLASWQLAFTFEGLVIGSVIYSLPFVYQPIRNSIMAIENSHYELAAIMGAGPLDRFFSVTLPLARNGFIAAAIIGFAHTLGEFGVILMIGGNIPGETQVLSVLLYELVEVGDYPSAHKLSALLLLSSFCLLLLMSRFSESWLVKESATPAFKGGQN